jgi:hypothetical protein
MAKYDHGGGCGCGLYPECRSDCEWHPDNQAKARREQAARAGILAAAPDLVAALRRRTEALRAILAITGTTQGRAYTALSQIDQLAREGLRS